MKRINLYLIFLTLLNFSCQNDYTLQDNRQDVNEFSKVWQENGKSGQRVKNTELMTNDGILVRSGEVYAGYDQVLEFLEKQAETANFIHQEYKTVKEWSSSEFYMSLGVRTITYFDNETGDTISTTVPALNIFERQPDGSLKLSCSMKDSSGN